MHGAGGAAECEGGEGRGGKTRGAKRGGKGKKGSNETGNGDRRRDLKPRGNHAPKVDGVEVLNTNRK